MADDVRSYGDEVAIVTVTYSPGALLDTFLDSLRGATTRTDVPVVLADNGSVDGAPERAARERDHVTFLPIGENVGYGAAANRGVASLPDRYGWVVVANPDLEWGAGSLDTLLDAGRRHPRAGALGPLIREPSGEVYPSAREVPSLLAGAGHAALAPVWPANPWTAAYRRSREDLTERSAGWLSGSCLLLRRAAFDSVDGFDPRYFMYFEDVDLGERLGLAGWRNVYVPGADVVHVGGASTGKPGVSARMLAEHHRSAYRYLADRHRGPVHAPLRAALRAGLAVRSGLLRRTG
ncbi:dTDP-Rha:A-D-GlcNAc-diphosphoryl polyprenol, A-3-L-rhamnosyl transferase WbbL [Pseudonocardia sp. Ae706_Ps2]|uniref:glycosyltransferase family 2 protein n=1 Tax=unclassified Pseudonocardia TaxID=2619320 RepID=UPI0009685893|nr:MULTISPECIES: glycosyltransferase family 2 protein [unclassified Pseudonocardia]OLM26418.1 dTDP-Rha:A-D-GlcNAc-diphosphoryl polyprenol, A-3-L-rhamnosyl transferase WbbL [Pseudonocardia sp. Ae706_Ps2]OLM33498.1 dTDP-Rha:A-D-GlcNAc-diphosphoryl polyprenol, A-3-L-rhamnosyl transferase WbbL [Pseudonocardia sp. Ae717_Ps2]